MNWQWKDDNNLILKKKQKALLGQHVLGQRFCVRAFYLITLSDDWWIIEGISLFVVPSISSRPSQAEGCIIKSDRARSMLTAPASASRWASMRLFVFLCPGVCHCSASFLFSSLPLSPSTCLSHLPLPLPLNPSLVVSLSCSPLLLPSLYTFLHFLINEK